MYFFYSYIGKLIYFVISIWFYFQLDGLNQSELASRLTLNCMNCYVEPQKLQGVDVTIMDVSNDTIWHLVKETLIWSDSVYSVIFAFSYRQSICHVLNLPRHGCVFFKLMQKICLVLNFPSYDGGNRANINSCIHITQRHINFISIVVKVIF